VIVGYSVVYVIGEGRPLDGDLLGSARGWLSWSDWVAGRAEDYPVSAQLAEDGWTWPAEKLAALARELNFAAKDQEASPDVRGVSRRLLAAVRLRPEGTSGLLVTDGTEGGEEDGEE
jgi:hypothetical protein